MRNSAKTLPKWLDIKVPQMRCDDNCGKCCGPVPISPKEQALIEEFCRNNGITPKENGSLPCGFYQKGKCAVYPVRPFLCRLFGHVPEMICIRGYNRNISQGKQKKFVERYSQKTHSRKAGVEFRLQSE